MMTQAAQSALRRGQLPFLSLSPSLSSSSDSLMRILSECSTVIEQYTKNVRFCIICNYVNKIIPAIQSRCTRFRCASLLSLLTSEALTDWSKGCWFAQVRTFTENWSWETFTTCHRCWKVRSSCSPTTSPFGADRVHWWCTAVKSHKMDDKHSSSSLEETCDELSTFFK